MMEAFDAARLLAMKKVKRQSLEYMKDGAIKALETLKGVAAAERQITAQKLRITQLTAEITRENGEIFALEQKLGIAREGKPGLNTGAV